MGKLIVLTLFMNIYIFSNYHDTSIVKLKDIDPTILQDVRYATKNNFTGKVLYKHKDVYLRYEVACSLKKVNDYLKKNYSYRLLVYDGYRPLSVQKIMWDAYPNTNYVASPKKGSRHNRGASVDLTLVDKDGKPLEMGTDYDDFTKKAHAYYKDLPKNVLANRKLLQDAMTKFGFRVMTSEWWHFDFVNWEKFNLIDYIPD